ncbi:MAG: tetratricopeptide repeat protein [Longimicrobiaceae bacterium]
MLAQGEPFDGFNVIDEWQSPAAVLPWQALRDVILWARRAETPARLFTFTAPERRAAELADPAIPDDIRAPLTVLSRVLEPTTADAREELAQACRAISKWADTNGFPQTAISFAQGAALIHTVHAGHAYQVALLCRRAAEYERAETWYRRALRLAVKSRDPSIAALSWLGLGNLFIQRGNYTAARTVQLRAFRIARRSGLWNIKGLALHDLFAVAVEQGQVVEAENLARQAFHAYPKGADRLPALASDVAANWLQQGFYGRALVVFRAVLPVLHLGSERLFIVSLIARAAAGAGDLALFTWAWTEAWTVLEREPTTNRACGVLYNLAYASACLGDWERARMAGEYSVEVATGRGEQQIARKAAELVGELELQRFEHSLTPSPEEPKVLERAEALALRIVRRLAARGGLNSPRARLNPF